MVLDIKSQDKSYRVTCSDWSMILKACSVNAAGCLALKNMIREKGKNLNLSFILEVQEYGFEDSIEFLYVPSVLSDLGYFKLSEEFSELSNFFLDKGKNSH